MGLYAMSKNISMAQLKAKLERVEARAEKLDEESCVLREQIENLDASYNPARDKFIKEGAAQIQEECGWTREELVNALGGVIDPNKKVLERRREGSKRTYLKLIPLDKDGTISEDEYLVLTPRLAKGVQHQINMSGIVPLLKHTIEHGPDEENKKKAEERLKEEKAKAKK
ncbi:hypothetical protein N9057_02385 [Akkermansiaceae bacterium]|nr:hypothetical protein [Akkermansiaceae bacterium]